MSSRVHLNNSLAGRYTVGITAEQQAHTKHAMHTEETIEKIKRDALGMGKRFFKKRFTKFHLISTKPPPPRFNQSSQHFDGRWYFCLRAQAPWVDPRPLVLAAPHTGQTIMHTN